MANSKRIADSSKELVSELLKAIGTPYAINLDIRVHGDYFDDLRGPLPNHYSDWRVYYKDLQAYALVAKNLDFSSEGLYERAAEDFFLIEGDNQRNNGLFFERCKLNHAILSKAKKELHTILKDQPDDVFFQKDLPIFGPGATSSCPAQDAVYPMKLEARPDITSEAINILEFFTPSDALVSFDPVEVIGNTFFTVPKNFKTERQCCKEPHLNTWFQRKLGLSMKYRLKKAGYILENIPDLNKWKLFHEADRYATIDLKQASDRLYYELIRYLVPPVWFDFLNRTRSRYTRVTTDHASILHKNEKFSSMGNGFTFELETCIFLALCRAIVPKKEHSLVTVFGDDIMVPSQYGESVVSLLQNLGLVINEEKTYLTGSFKESCGVDVWTEGLNTICVRPIYLKGIPKDAAGIIELLNMIRRISLRLHGLPPKATAFNKAYGFWLKKLPKEFQIYGPDPHFDEDMKMLVPLYIKSDIDFIYSDSNRGLGVKITKGLSPKLTELDENGWLHSNQTKPAKRVTRKPIEKYRIRPWRFRSSTHMAYALSGGDPAGCFSRSTPYEVVVTPIVT